jgi:hypothetical protein
MSKTFVFQTLPENFRKRLTPETRKTMHCPTQPEADAKQEERAEKHMHIQFEQWLRLNEIPFVHSRMDRKSTIREGWPDFSLFKNGATCFVEFKVPGKEPTEKQLECLNQLNDNGFPILVATDVGDAIHFASAALGMLTPQDASDTLSATVYPDGNKNASQANPLRSKWHCGKES